VGTPLRDAAWLEVVRLAGFTVALLPVSLWCTRAAVRRSQRTGTIIEY
jgi:hypothetical protein